MYYNQFFVANNNNEDPLMANYYYYDNITSPHQQTNAAVIKQEDLIPVFQYNSSYATVLQDDNFSIASYPIVPELRVAPTPLPLLPTSAVAASTTTTATYLQVDQPQQFYYQSDLSPQLSECFSTSSASSNGFNMSYYPQADPVFMDSLFPPVMDSNSSSSSSNGSDDGTRRKRKTTSLTDKRHICPVCSHR